jgi:hypothetical protein
MFPDKLPAHNRGGAAEELGKYQSVKSDGLVKSPIYFIAGLARQFAVLLPKCRTKNYAVNRTF